MHDLAFAENVDAIGMAQHEGELLFDQEYRGAGLLQVFDEPTAGLSPAETRRVVAMVHELPRDMTIVMIEHDMDVAFELADRIAVMHLGRLIAEGDQAAIRSNQQVTDIYLGAE